MWEEIEIEGRMIKFYSHLTRDGIRATFSKVDKALKKQIIDKLYSERDVVSLTFEG